MDYFAERYDIELAKTESKFKKQYPLIAERLEILEMALYDEAGGQRTEFAINQLRMMQEFAQAPGLTPLSSELEEGLADVLTFAQALFGGMGDARDGFAQDIEHERN